MINPESDPQIIDELQAELRMITKIDDVFKPGKKNWYFKDLKNNLSYLRETKFDDVRRSQNMP